MNNHVHKTFGPMLNSMCPVERDLNRHQAELDRDSIYQLRMERLYQIVRRELVDDPTAFAEVFEAFSDAADAQWQALEESVRIIIKARLDNDMPNLMLGAAKLAASLENCIHDHAVFVAKQRAK